jgi:hypothetical protein
MKQKEKVSSLEKNIEKVTISFRYNFNYYNGLFILTLKPNL